MHSILVVFRLIAALMLLAGALPPQASPGEDPASLPVVNLTANATHSQRNRTAVKNAYAVRNSQTITDSQVVVSNCDLLVDGDGHLRLERCWLRVQGDIFLKERGLLELIDCRVELSNTYPKQFNYWWEGGELRTTRCLIGGRAFPAGSPQTSTFELHRGLWNAFQTTVQYSGGIQIGLGRLGYGQDPFLRGGTLYADGLQQGATADAVIVSGYGDVVLKNSTFNLNVSLYADSGQTTQSAFDFTTLQPISGEVYGDRNVIDSLPLTRAPVTRDVPGLPYRLEIENTVVPFWFVGIYGVATTGPRTTFEFQDPAGLIVGIHALDLQGSPVPVGPWATYGTRIPQLPATQSCGADDMPPGCGVRIGNLDIVAPSNRPARISSWSFYLEGPQTNFSIQGPTKIAEIFMLDGQLAITGSEAYDARVDANTISLHRNASLTLQNVSIGQFDSTVSVQRYLELQGMSSCTIQHALIHGLKVRSRPEVYCCINQGVEATTLSVSDFLECDMPLDAVATGASAFTVQRATPAQNFDLTNVNMDTAPVGGAPAFWSSSNLLATATTDTRPLTTSQASNELQSLSNTSTMSKSLPVAAGSFVAARAWVKPITAPANSSLQFTVSGSASGVTSVNVPLTAPSTNNGWIQVILPPHKVAALDGPIDVAFVFTGTGLTVRLDDIDIRPTSWWDRNTVTNLDFDEDDTVGYSFPPTEYRYPAFWSVWNCNAMFDTNVIRPLAAPGSRSVRLAVTGGAGQLFKILEDIAPGTNIHVTGWIRVISPVPQPLKVHVGDNARWWDSTYGNNQIFYAANPTAWTPFTLNYLVPSNGSMTRIIVTGGAPGDDILVDDIEVTLQ
jgi:hypothetical protein